VKIEDISNSELSELIDEWIHSERDRCIMKSRLIDGLTFERLAEKHDMSTRHIKRVVYKCEQQIFKHCKFSK
jgi:hypothetical protein